MLCTIKVFQSKNLLRLKYFQKIQTMLKPLSYITLLHEMAVPMQLRLLLSRPLQVEIEAYCRPAAYTILADTAQTAYTRPVAK